MKITRFAFAAKCGSLGVSGSAGSTPLANSASIPGKSSEEPASERRHARRDKPNCGAGNAECEVADMIADNGVRLGFASSRVGVLRVQRLQSKRGVRPDEIRSEMDIV
jgi:hypothetical protein